MATLLGLTTIVKPRETSWETFVRLYDQREDSLQRASERFTQAAAGVKKRHEGIENETAQVMFSVGGGAFGALSGAITGGIWGALGAVSAATFARFCEEINAVGATVGFAGSVFGGVVGGVFSGGIGSAVVVAGEVAGAPVHGVVSNVVWFTVGFATGCAIGGTFGGSVGATGGAIGGGLGALHATTGAVYLARQAIDCSRTKDSKGEGKWRETANMMQEIGRDFDETIKPLLEELKIIQQFCANVASDHAAKGVAEQAAKTLTAAATMEKSMSDSQRAAGLPQFICCVEEAARQCKKIPEELKKTRGEVERFWFH